MSKAKRNLVAVLITLLFLLAIGLRIAANPAENLDTNIYLRWHGILVKEGFSAFSKNFGVYTPPYVYLLWLASLFKEVLPPLVAVKLIPTLFDGLSSIAVYKLVRLKYPQGPVPWLAAAGFLVLPTVLANSAYWGQVDSVYASFLLWCIYFLLTERPLPAVLAYGIAIAVKGQAIFLIPFLGVMVLRRRIPWTYIPIPPLVYVLFTLPAVLAGRPFMDLLTLYFKQVNAFPQLAMHAPNLYSIIPARFAPIAYYGGLAAAAIILGVWMFYYGLNKAEMTTPRAIMLTALLSLVLVPFLIPKVHDRYFYPADILSYVMAFFVPVYGIVAAGYQLISGLVYYIFLRSVTPEQNLFMLRSAAALNTIMVSGLVIHQFLFLRRPATPMKKSAEEAAIS
jgi:Gpi18-like mannosyltransferase